MTTFPIRNRFVSAGLAVIAAWLAVHTRHYGDQLPEFIAEYAPDTLWAMAIFAAIGLFFPAAATWQVASGAYVVSSLVELSQLYHQPWLDAIRQTPLGAQALGTEFLAANLTCYAVGVILGMLIELWTLH